MKLFFLFNQSFGAGLGLYALRKKNHVDTFTKVTGYLLCILILLFYVHLIYFLGIIEMH